MTKFVKEEFKWDGMYLMYGGAFDGAKMMMDVHPNAHPSWEGKLMPAFVARFK
jgi:ribosomal protein L31